MSSNSESTLQQKLLGPAFFSKSGSEASSKQFESSFVSVDLDEEILKERQQGLEQFHDDIKGIHQLYQDFSMHVQAQDQSIDDIESQLNESKDNSQLAAEQVTIAATHQRSYARRSICILLLTSIAAVILIVLVATHKI